MYNWKLFHNDALIEEYEDVLLFNNIIHVSDNLKYDINNKTIYRNDLDYSIKIDLQREFLHLKIDEKGLETNIKLNNVSLKEEGNVLTIKYQIDKDEPINTIIISKGD